MRSLELHLNYETIRATHLLHCAENVFTNHHASFSISVALEELGANFAVLIGEHPHRDAAITVSAFSQR
jgi:hypothetical protein